VCQFISGEIVQASSAPCNTSLSKKKGPSVSRNAAAPRRPPGGVNARWLPTTKITKARFICDEIVAVPGFLTRHKLFEVSDGTAIPTTVIRYQSASIVNQPQREKLAASSKLSLRVRRMSPRLAIFIASTIARLQMRALTIAGLAHNRLPVAPEDERRPIFNKS